MPVLEVLDGQGMVSVARAFNQFLNLANIAEQSETTRGAYNAFPNESHLAELFGRLAQSHAPEEIFSAVSRAS